MSRASQTAALFSIAYDPSGQCNQILQIDKWNPQVAARLCNRFTFVKKLPANQKEKAVAEITRVLSETTLSKNSRELLEKCI